MADSKNVPIRTVYKVLKKLEARGELEAYLAECEKSKQEASIPEGLYERTVTQLAGDRRISSGTGTCPCIGPDE